MGASISCEVVNSGGVDYGGLAKKERSFKISGLQSLASLGIY